MEVIKEIQEFVAKSFRITPALLKGRCRRREYSYPRMLAMYITREVTGASYPQIAKQFGGFDHTSVIHACKWARKASEYEEYIEDTIGRFQHAVVR